MAELAESVSEPGHDTATDAATEAFAREAAALYRDVVSRLGSHLADVGPFPRRVAIRIGDRSYYRHAETGEPVAFVVRDRNAYWARVEPDGRTAWQLFPLSPEAS